MEVEYETKVITMDERYEATIEGWKAEGWSLAPGAKPIAIYFVARAKVKAEPGVGSAMGRLIVDDSKVGILRDGKWIG